MLFAVTHFDTAGHRRKARVAARSWADALAQMNQAYGQALHAHCMRLPQLGLRLVTGGRDATRA